MCGEATLEASVSDAELENPIIDVDVPESLVIVTDRVGEYTSYVDEVRPGETVRFDYSGGSEYGTRNVLVVKVHGDSLEGLTLERDGGYRKYLSDHIDSNLLFVKPFVKQNSSESNVKRVRFDEAGTALLASLTGEQLAELYGKYVAVEGDGTRFDSNAGEVVVQLPAPKSTFKVMRDETFEPAIVITNKVGQRFSIFRYPDSNEVGVVNERTSFNNSQVSPEQFRDELVNFLA